MNGYILQLDNGKYYVGTCNDIKHRIKKHIHGQGSAWTKKHKYKSTCLEVDIDDDCALEWEKQTTLQMMRYFGWENVRGYAWTSCNLTHPPRDL